MLWLFKSKKAKRREEKQNRSSVAQYAQQRNAVETERSRAIRELETQTHGAHERFTLLLKTYSSDRDVVVVPESWKNQGSDPEGFRLQTQFHGNKIFVETPMPSIVRRR